MSRYITEKTINKKSGKTVRVGSEVLLVEHYYLMSDCIIALDFLENEHHYWITDTRLPKRGERCKCGKVSFQGEK